MKPSQAYYGFLPLIVLYFFFNNTFLPEGLLYTGLLTPVFLYYLYKKAEMKAFLKWSFLLILPVGFHLYLGIDTKTYLVSTILILSAWIFLFAALEATREIGSEMETFFRKILLFNALFVSFALLLLAFPAVQDFCWYSKPISAGIPAFPRLKLFAYEPSHYGLLLSPVFLFYTLKLIMGKTKHKLLYALGIGIPLLLSLSFGILGAMIMALLVVIVIHYKKLPRLSFLSGLFGVLSLLVIVLVATWLWPDNPVSIRLSNIFTGTDTSANGRLFDSFMFATDLVVNYQAWFGVGPGQVKILAHDLIISHYQYSGELAEVVRIPNSMAEMLAIYGWYGFVVKIGLEIYFFIKLRIHKNMFSLTLFIFIFIYQFTGSFMMNIAEIGIWVLVFAGRFDTFDKKQAMVKT